MSLSVALRHLTPHKTLSNRSIAVIAGRQQVGRGSPTSAMRWARLRIVKLTDDTSPRSTSSQVHGAETGAPRLARTV